VGDGLVGVLRAARLTAWLFFVVASRRGRKSQTFATAREDARALWESTVHRAETDLEREMRNTSVRPAVPRRCFPSAAGDYLLPMRTAAETTRAGSAEFLERIRGAEC